MAGLSGLSHGESTSSASPSLQSTPSVRAALPHRAHLSIRSAKGKAVNYTLPEITRTETQFFKSLYSL